MYKRVFFGMWLVCLNAATTSAMAWGFYAHKQINRLAMFGLPPEMLPFYKCHSTYIIENAVNPDRRRYAVPGEAARHYIDLETYGDSALFHLPYQWKQAVAQHSEDTLQAHGIVPWCILQVKYQLTEAFRQHNRPRILALSADLGHYIGDSNVPLHTTHNYDGQLTGQRGIHGLWEARLPELLDHTYDYWVGQAQYVPHPAQRVWQALQQAHAAVDSVLLFEKQLSARFPADKKYSFETKGGVTQRVYARAYAEAYHQLLHGQVERQMRASITMVRDFWYTCWVDAGQPDLQQLIDGPDTPLLPDSLHLPGPPLDSLQIRPHETETGFLPFHIPDALPTPSAQCPMPDIWIWVKLYFWEKRCSSGLCLKVYDKSIGLIISNLSVNLVKCTSCKYLFVG